jgi:hypothetical protein
MEYSLAGNFLKICSNGELLNGKCTQGAKVFNNFN